MGLNNERSKYVASAMVVGVLAVAGLFIWQMLQERANAAKTEGEILKGLTKDEVKQVVKSAAKVDPPAIKSAVEDTAKRKAFLSGLREHLALAAQARREGYADLEDFKINFEYKKDILLADLYRAKLSQGKSREYVVPKKQLDALWKDPANEKAFARDMQALQRIRVADAKAKGTMVPPQNMAGAILEKARDNWARAKILSSSAKKDREFMSSPAIPLRFKILEAGILAADYMRANFDSFDATDWEIRAYLSKHPEYDVRRKLALAKEVLAKARAGEDLEKLAVKYSEDSVSRERGGIYKDMAAGSLWPELEAAALSMKNGEMYDGLVESKDGYHIFQLVDKQQKNGGTRLTVRHILIHKRFREPGEEVGGVPRPFMTPEEIAKREVSKMKRAAFVEDVIAKNPISLPEDFEMALEDVANASGTAEN